ncbi:hypothetical protein GEMRC1_001267 [Eukaryota sp. GEM-RC1]
MDKILDSIPTVFESGEESVEEQVRRAMVTIHNDVEDVKGSIGLLNSIAQQINCCSESSALEEYLSKFEILDFPLSIVKSEVDELCPQTMPVVNVFVEKLPLLSPVNSENLQKILDIMNSKVFEYFKSEANVHSGITLSGKLDEILTNVTRLIEAITSPLVPTHGLAPFSNLTPSLLSQEFKVLSAVASSNVYLHFPLICTWCFRHDLDSAVTALRDFCSAGFVVNDDERYGFSAFLAGYEHEHECGFANRTTLQKFEVLYGHFLSSLNVRPDYNDSSEAIHPLIQILSLLSDSFEFFRFLQDVRVQFSDSYNDLSEIMLNSSASFFCSESVRAMFMTQILESSSFFNSIVQHCFLKPPILPSFVTSIQQWIADRQFAETSLNRFVQDFNRCKQSLSSLQQLVSSEGQEFSRLQLISQSNFREGRIEFLQGFQASLHIDTIGGVTNLDPDEFKDVMNQYILRYGNSLDEMNTDSSRPILQFLKMSQQCLESITIFENLSNWGYPLNCFPLIVNVFQLDDFVLNCRTLLNDWKSEVEHYQRIAKFSGICGIELASVFSGTFSTSLCKVFTQLPTEFGPLPPNDSFPPSPQDDSVYKRAFDYRRTLNPAIESNERRTHVFLSTNLQDIFMDSLSIASKYRISLDLGHVLLCDWHVSAQSLSCFLASSEHEMRLIVAPEQLSPKILEFFKSFVLSADSKIQLCIATASDRLCKSLCDASIEIPTTSQVFTPCIADVLRSSVPGNGKTAYAMNYCRATVTFSGGISTSGIIEDLRCFDGETDTIALLVDIQKPLDVMKRQQFKIEHFLERNDNPSEVQHFYQLAASLFSLSYLHGIRHNGRSIVNNFKLYLEFPAEDEFDRFSSGVADEISWVSLLLNMVCPNIKPRTFGFNPEVILFHEDDILFQYATLCKDFLRAKYPSDTSPSWSILSKLLTDTFANSEGIPEEECSFKHLIDVIAILGPQMIAFNSSAHYSSVYLDDHATEFNTTEFVNEAREFLVANCRRIGLLENMSHATPLSWHAEKYPIFFHDDEMPCFIIPDVSSVPPNLLRGLQVMEPSCNGRYINPAPVPEDPFERLQQVRQLNSLRQFNPTVLQTQFPDFVYTKDVFLKQLIIATRLKANRPMILSSHSGVGKTYLIRHLAALLFSNTDNESLLYELCFNAGTCVSELFEKIRLCNARAQSLSVNDSNHFPILFLDEVNASDHVGLVCSLLTNRNINSVQLHPAVRLICAINPYGATTADGQLMYSVYPIPRSLCSCILNFGALNDNDEQDYIAEILKHSSIDVPSYTIRSWTEVITLIHTVIKNANGPLISLRDVKRFVLITESMYALLNSPDDKVFKFNVDPCNYSAALSLFVCYAVRVENRNLRLTIENIINSDVASGAMSFIKSTMRNFGNIIPTPDELDIVLNDALLENLFVMLCGILSRIPVIIVGVPGQSKSLALSLLISYLTGTKKKFSFPPPTPSTFKAVSSAEDKSRTLDPTSKSRAVLIIDELSLMQDSPARPLKALHSVLEPRDRLPLFSFIGVSNFGFDAAPSSRSLIVCRPAPSAQETFETINDLTKTN